MILGPGGHRLGRRAREQTPTARALPRPPGGAERPVGGSVHAHLGHLPEVALGHRTGMDRQPGPSNDPTTVTSYRASGRGVPLTEASRVSQASRASWTRRGHGGQRSARRARSLMACAMFRTVNPPARETWMHEHLGPSVDRIRRAGDLGSIYPLVRTLLGHRPRVYS